VDGELVCPKCGAAGAKIVTGEEFYVEAIDVED
jgi:Zn finger protein HypA/HybF involved in hydrogenase expression